MELKLFKAHYNGKTFIVEAEDEDEAREIAVDMFLEDVCDNLTIIEGEDNED